ncbi:hypothetical protein HY933_02525 [Candidatus Falkowbacteria bacterium]|nr:hypothetical protein [Candidatus Falkowbacteria bacterium]
MDTQDLKDPATLLIAKDLTADCILYSQTKEAYDLFNAFRVLIDNDPALRKDSTLRPEYENLIRQLRWIALPMLSWRELGELFREQFTVTFGFPENFDLLTKLQVKLLTIPVHHDRDQYKQQLRRALVENKEKITNQSLTVGERQLEPTIGSWLLMYNNALGTGPADEVKYREWLTQNKDFAALSQEQKDRLITIFNLYEKLKYSSTTLAGLEDPVVMDDIEGQPRVFTEGDFQPVDDYDKLLKEAYALTGRTPQPVSDEEEEGEEGEKNQPSALSLEPRSKSQIPSPKSQVPNPKGEAVPVTKPLTTAPAAPVKYSQEEIIKRYQVNQGEIEEIARLAADAQSRFANNLPAIISALQQAIQANPPDRSTMLSLLYLLARLGSLGALLRSGSPLVALVQDTLQHQGQTQLAADFRLHPGDPRFIVWLLSHLLETKLKMTENDSARFGLRLANLGKQAGDGRLSQLAYFDMDTGEFRWKR